MFTGLIFVVSSGLVSYLGTYPGKLCLLGIYFCDLQMVAKFAK